MNDDEQQRIYRENHDRNERIIAIARRWTHDIWYNFDVEPTYLDINDDDVPRLDLSTKV